MSNAPKQMTSMEAMASRQLSSVVLASPPVSIVVVRRRNVASRIVGEEIGDRDGLIAVRAGTAWTEAPAEDATVIATLLTNETRLAIRALVDDDRLGRRVVKPRKRSSG